MIQPNWRHSLSFIIKESKHFQPKIKIVLSPVTSNKDPRHWQPSIKPCRTKRTCNAAPSAKLIPFNTFELAYKHFVIQQSHYTIHTCFMICVSTSCKFIIWLLEVKVPEWHLIWLFGLPLHWHLSNRSLQKTMSRWYNGDLGVPRSEV